MKKIIIPFAFLFYFSSLWAQNLDDVIRFNEKNYTGTARSLSMANAFGALGGDLTSIAINPAAVAVYRTSEFAFTPGFSFTPTQSDWNGSKAESDVFNMQFNQIGGVTTYKSMHEKKEGLISTSIGFTYNRLANFNKSVNIYRENVPIRHTYLDAAADYASDNTLRPENLPDNEWLLYQTFLLNPIAPDSTNYFNAYEELTDAIYTRNTGGINHRQLIESSGNSGEYGLSLGANISNKFMLGASLNFISYKYRETVSILEENTRGLNPSYSSDISSYQMQRTLAQDGFGINAKFGAIANLHPVRIGFSIATPTAISFKEDYSNEAKAYYFDGTEGSKLEGTYDYSYRTPYHINLSGAYVYKKLAVISVDYEMTDHTFAKFSEPNDFSNTLFFLNQQIEASSKVAHNIRTGLEVKPLPYLALRAGFAFIDSPLKEEYVGYDMARYMYSGGLGFKNKSFFCDLGLSTTQYKSNYYIHHYSLTSTTLNTSNYQLAFTFGWKM